MSKLDEKIELVYKDPKSLVPYVKNAKLHSQEQLDRLAGLIAAHGFDQPIVIDANNVIIKGHGRRQAAINLNMKEVPCIVSTLEEYEAMAARIGDNAVVSKEYNLEVLKFDLGTLKNKGMDLKLTGMTPLELKPLVMSDAVSPQIIGSSSPAPMDNPPEQPGEMQVMSGPPLEASEPPAPSAPSEGYFMDRTPIIQYNIIFDDKEQQEKFLTFVKSLKTMYPNLETIAGRLVRFVEDNYHEGEMAPMEVGSGTSGGGDINSPDETLGEHDYSEDQ